MRRFLFILFIAVGVVLFGCGTEEQPAPNQGYKKQTVEPELSVFMHETGQTQKMKLESYIEGVVAGEMRGNADINALAAQAIMARTFTLQAFEKGQLTSRGTNASTDIREFQAYSAEKINDNIKKAVAMTRGEVATYQGIPIIAWFHASAGGVTARAKEGLDYPYNEPPYTKSTASPDEMAPANIQQWTASFSKDELITALEELKVDVTAVNQLQIGRKGESGRAETLIFNGNTKVQAPRLRLALGSTKLKSLLLDEIKIDGDTVVFSGKGYGHGVGMSQWGAEKLAADGKSPEEIVKYYFKDVVIEKRW